MCRAATRYTWWVDAAISAGLPQQPPFILHLALLLGRARDSGELVIYPTRCRIVRRDNVVVSSPPVALIHSPLTSAAAWGDVPDLLRASGLTVVVPEVLDDNSPSYSAHFVARVALQLVDECTKEHVVLVGHGDAGPLLAQIGFARHAVGAPSAGYVFVDSDLPRGDRTSSRLDLMRLRDPTAAKQLDAQLEEGLRVPDWRESELAATVPSMQQRAVLLAGLRPRDHTYYTEPLPPAEEWPDARCAYLRLSREYESPAKTARHRGWDVSEHSLHHFAALTDPGVVADALRELIAFP